MESGPSASDLRTRLAEALEAGKTIALSQRELEDARLRAQLPQLLDELAQARGDAVCPLRIPGYTVLGEIGQGGMSTVYLARQDALGRHVAVKLAPRWLGGGERIVERLRQEAHAMARLSHPNIVAIHDVLEIDDTVVIVMEWVDGRTLQSLLRSLGEVSPDGEVTALGDMLGATTEARGDFEPTAMRFFVRLMHDVARATHAVHECGLLHLDIKPSNVLVRRDGTPLLADFGVVREMAADTAQTRTFAGTPLYSAPEQLRRHDAAIGPHTDVYGLGMTLYEALAREQPLRGLDLPGILECVEAGRVPRLSAKVAVTADLENIVHKAIAPEPQHRYASAQEFADDLLAFLEHRPVLARPLSRAQRLHRWVRNEPWKAGLAAALVVLVPSLLALGAYLLLQLPEIERIERARRLAAANALKQEAFQHSLTHDSTPERNVALLEQALELDPGNGSLACLAVMLNERHPDLAAAELAKHPARTERTAALRLFRDKATQGRSFFDRAEVATLRASRDPADRYVLALERTVWAGDADYEEAWAEAQQALIEALLLTGTDPLLYGALAWTSYRAGDRATCEAACAALATHWADDPIARSWHVITVEQSESDLARQLAEELIAAAPRHPRPYELRAGIERRKAGIESTAAVLRRAADAGVSSHYLRSLESRLAFASGQERFDRANRDSVNAPKTRLGQITAAFEDDREFALELTEPILTEVPPTAFELAEVHRLAFERGEKDLQDRAWALFREHFPDRRDQHGFRAIRLANDRKFDEAADLVAETDFPANRIDDYALIEVHGHMALRRWQELRLDAERWLRLGSGRRRQEAMFYAGLAAARLGDITAATDFLAGAVVRGATGSWHASALLEDAALRASPDSPPEVRDAKLAALRLEMFEALNRRLKAPHRGPWTECVRSLVRFATGDREGALTAARRGLQFPERAHEPHAPEDYRARLQAALERCNK